MSFMSSLVRARWPFLLWVRGRVPGKEHGL